MPYKIFKVDGGYKVGKKDNSKMNNASNKPMSYKKAVAQMKAIIISENN